MVGRHRPATQGLNFDEVCLTGTYGHSNSARDDLVRHSTGVVDLLDNGRVEWLVKGFIA
jgi:hypothetical protein